MPDQLIRNISDTARWAAVFRAHETRRKDALFHDPFAQRLAGERGEEIARAMTMHLKHSWSWVMRTYVLDDYITRQIGSGVDTIVNLAAGLDARPYRMALPTTLRWIEVDLPELLAYKDEALAGEQPRCVLERVPLDLADVPRRRALFAQIGASAKRVMIVSEGLLIYLSTEEVAALAADLATPASFHYWAFDVVSPGLLEMMRKQGGGGDELARAGAPLKFAPPEGPDFFRQFGWTPLEVRSAFKVASKVGRLPWSLKPFGLFPESNSRQGKRPWSGFCLCERSAGA